MVLGAFHRVVEVDNVQVDTHVDMVLELGGEGGGMGDEGEVHVGHHVSVKEVVLVHDAFVHNDELLQLHSDGDVKLDEERILDDDEGEEHHKEEDHPSQKRKNDGLNSLWIMK